MKKFAAAVLPILLTGCVATSDGLKEDQVKLTNLFKKNKDNNRVYAQLVKDGDNYQFTNFTLYSNSHKLNEAWVNLSNKEPLWNYSSVERCAVYNTGNDWADNPCTTASEARFMERTYDAEANAKMTMGMLGLNTLLGHYVLVSFQSDDYFNAFASAENITFSSQNERSEKLSLISNTVKKLKAEYKDLKNDYQYLTSKSPSDFEVGEILPASLSYSRKFDSIDGLISYLESYQVAINTAKSDIAIEKTNLNNFIEKKELLAAKRKAEYRNKKMIETRQEQQTALARIKSTADAKAYLNKYQSNGFKDKTLFSKGEELYSSLLNKDFSADYKKLSSLSSYNSFINKYTRLSANITDKQLLSNARKQQQSLIQAKQKKDVEQFVSLVTNFRTELSEGQDSHCGLVVEVKDKVARVQTMTGLMFIKRDQLYPVGAAQCNFYNNVYQPPVGLPI